MALASGARLGPYEILSPLGAGGMGEVYRARDTRLGREVAIKVLPEHLAKNPEALARFEREAKAVAAVSHPNILALYDVGAGVQEYITVLLAESKVIWRRLVAGAYNTIEPDSDGLLRSILFPGLWLDPDALLNQDTLRILEVLNHGLQSSEHHQFVQALAKRKTARP